MTTHFTKKKLIVVNGRKLLGNRLSFQETLNDEFAHEFK